MTVSLPGGGPSVGDPTVLKILLGAQLRRLRDIAGVSRDDAGYHIRASGSKISRLELGRVSFKERDVADLLDLYAVTGEQKDQLLQLTHEANATPWWQKYREVVPDWFQVYVGLEEAAALIRIYEVQFVPGLLQTEDYARAVVMQGAPSLSPEEIDSRVAVRMGRQKLFSRENPARLWAIVDEAALRRPIGSRDVLAGQVNRLIDATSEPTSRSRSCRSSTAATRPRAAPSRSCGSPRPTCRTWSTWSTSPARTTSTSPRTWSCTPRSWSACRLPARRRRRRGISWGTYSRNSDGGATTVPDQAVYNGMPAGELRGAHWRLVGQPGGRGRGACPAGRRPRCRA